MDGEYSSLMANDTWDLVPLPKGRKLVRCKWVYRTKYASDGIVERLKARLVQEEIYKRKFTWNNLLDMFRITLALSVSLRNPYMALSKLLELGMPKWMSFSLTLVFLEVILTPMSIPRK